MQEVQEGRNGGGYEDAREVLLNKPVSVCDWPLRHTNKQEMVRRSEGSCFGSRPLGDVGDSASGGGFSLAPSKPLCIIIITTLQLQLQGTGQQRTAEDAWRSFFYFWDARSG